MRIAAIETRTYRYPLDPPFCPAWDPVPRDVPGRDDRGRHAATTASRGTASGDGLPDRALLERHLVGLDPLRTEVVREVCETVDLHHGRPWTLEVAVWDLVGRALGEPVWRLLGGRGDAHHRVRVDAASSSRAEERARRCLALRDAGGAGGEDPASLADWRIDLPVIEAVREAVGGGMEIMVDANQGWRMPGDLAPRWDVATAAQFAHAALERLGVYWLEEPLRTDDVDGYAALRRRTDLRLAAGEIVRQRLTRRATSCCAVGLDVVQTDVVLIGGIGGCRRIAALADLPGAPGARTRGRTATGCSPTCMRRSRSRRARSSRCPSIHRRGRPSGATGFFR